jgi:PKD repeat protein
MAAILDSWEAGMRYIRIFAATLLSLGGAWTASAQFSINCPITTPPPVIALDDVVHADPPPAGQPLLPIAVLVNDIVPSGTTVTVTIATHPLTGVANVSGSSIVYRPNGTFFPDSLVYRITSTEGEMSEATVRIVPNQIVDVTVSCTGIGCLFDAKPRSGMDGIRTFVWSFDDGTPNAVGGSRQYHEFRSNRVYDVTVEAHYYSGQIAHGSYSLNFQLTQNLEWPVTVSGLGASLIVTYNDLQNFPQGAAGLDVKIWWSDYAYPCGVYAPPCSTEPQNVSAYGSAAHDTTIFACDFNPQCRVAQTYARSGTYRVRLQLLARNTPTVLHEWTKYITIENRPPDPRFTHEQLVGRQIHFKLDPKTDEWDIDEIPRDWIFGFRPGPYEWDFGDGTFFTTNDPVAVNKNYPLAGDYQAKLKVTDVNGAAGYVTRTVTITNTPPVAAIASSCRGLKCTFHADVADDTFVPTRTWSFGDGLESTTGSHTFSAPGCYTVTLRATDNDGATTEVQSTISVAEGPGAAGVPVFVDSRSGSFSTFSADSNDVGTTGNLNGILEPGEIVLIEPAWPSNVPNGEYTQWSLASRPPLATAAGFTARRYNHRDYVGYDLRGPLANCFALNGCQAIGVTRTAPRTAAHVDVQWRETRPAPLAELPVTVHVGESFTDVPKTHADYAAVESILHAGLTTGCTATGFCVNEAFTRDQIAVWLLRARYGATYTPPACSGDPFPDVPCSGPNRHWAADWIAKLKADGITSGTGAGLYEPARGLSRAEMVVFLLRTMQGSGYTPPACGQDYLDVPCAGASSHWAAGWLSDFKRRVGPFYCSGQNFCPDSPVTRGTAAAFFSAAWHLELDHRQCDPAQAIAPATKTVGATIIGHSPAISSEWAIGYAVDGNPYTDYASAGTGANTYIDFDLGSVQDIVEVQFTDRRSSGGANGSGTGSGADAASRFNLIFSTDAVFGNADDKIVSANSEGPLRDTRVRANYGAGIPARYVRYDVVQMFGNGVNTGAAEFVFKARVSGAAAAQAEQEISHGGDMSHEAAPPPVTVLPTDISKQ